MATLFLRLVGSSGSLYDFNEANMKLALNSELRFPIFYKFNGAIFADLGNIWNYLDAIEEEFKFKGFNSLKEVAVGLGLWDALRPRFVCSAIRFRI